MAFKLIIVFLVILTAIVTSKKTNIPKIRHAIKTIRVKDGDIVDCVDIYKQPAFDHPVLKNHMIQMKSSHLEKYTSKTLQNSGASKATAQPWLQYGRCPNGTVPIRRSPNNHHTNIYPRKYFRTIYHSYALVLDAAYNYTGARANIKVWNPYVESASDYSSSQVMVRACLPGSIAIVNETVEAGWMVNPGVYKDNKTRLFTYWSVDANHGTGCFDLICPGFIQTSNVVLLGGDIGSYNYGSEISFQISKDPDTNNWWFLYNSEEVGYWPSHLFQSMKYEANLVEWGGEVYSPKVGTHPHTETAMGSGQFADRKYQLSGTMSGLLIEDNSSPLKPPYSYTLASDEWTCYDADLLQEQVPEPVFVYGGPGSRSNPNC